MIKTTLFSCFLLALLFAASGCGKEDNPTTIQGRITDRKTGQAIEKAGITLGLKRKKDNGQDEYFTQFCQSDANGGYRCTLEGDYSISDISKTGYITHEKNLPVINGQENNIDISLVPRDGFLRLRIENNTGLNDTIYTSIYSQIEDAERVYSGENPKIFPVILQTDEIYTEVFDLASPEILRIKWGFKRTTYEALYTYQDSILIVPNDTSTYILSY